MISHAVCPPFVFGPYAPEFYPVSPQNHSSNNFIYGLVHPEEKISWSSAYVDVRDLAKAHVNALKSPPTADVGRKRVIIGYPYPLDGKHALEILAEKRPQWKSRLNQRQPPDGTPAPSKFGCDFARIEEVLGIKETEFLTSEQVCRTPCF
jgi:nucleoside-diphosphate-sugar epimerase